MLEEPAWDGVKVTEQEPRVSRVQLVLGVKVPVGPLVTENVTEPVGVVVTPVGVMVVAGVVSLTVTVQFVPCPTTIVAGVHVTDVEVGLELTVRVVEPVLPEWVESPEYVPETSIGPGAAGTTWKLHDAVGPDPVRVQVKVGVNVTVPVGVVAPVEVVSVTVAVHVVAV